MHYARIPHQYWRHRLQMMKGMGLNTVATYVFWNLHEPEPGKWDFTGDKNLAEFIKTAGEEGMMVILRPGPYVCAEWEMGGLPWWLLKKKDVRLRESDPYFIERVALFEEAVAKQVKNLTIANGGPIIMVQVENEYGSYGNDRTYMKWIHDLWRDKGIEVPFYTADGATPYMLEAGTLPGVAIGLDPAVYMCAGFEAPTTPLGYNELQIAGALRGEAVELANCLTIPEKCIANAEYVLEGYLCHDKTVREDINSNTGKAMPEFPGYTGDAKPALPVIKVTAVTHRKNPIMQSCIGPSHEHVSMAGIPTEASIISMVDRAIPGRLLNVHAAPCGGGKFVAIMQFKKSSKNDEGRQRNAALLAFSAFSELKHVFLVDEDVDIFDMSDVMWAMTTRFQADVDMISIPGCHCHVLDPSNDHALDPSIRVHGIACKAIFDCTVPFDQKENFVRSRFMEIDKDKWAKELAF